VEAEAHRFPPPLDGHYPVVDGRVQTRALEAHVVDHCNLTCAGCCSLSPALAARFDDPAALARDLALAARVLAPRVFKLVGGEPLLHPELAALAAAVRASGIAPRVSLTTNGLLLARAPDAVWAALDAVTVSLYPRVGPGDDDRARIAARAAEHRVALNWKRQDRFVAMDRATPCDDPAENAAVFGRCWIRERCHLLRDGVFYTCTRPAHFRSYLGAARDLSGDGLRLHEGPAMGGELLAYLTRAEALAACSLCHGGDAPTAPHRLLTRAELTRLRRERA
jgi:cyclic pyranopterin phosphate synthase